MRFFCPPFQYKPEGYMDGPAIFDANGQLVATLFWPWHSPEDTESAETETHALGRAMAAAASPVPHQGGHGADPEEGLREGSER